MPHRGGPLEVREVPARVLEERPLVDHRQLEVRVRVVDRLAPGLGHDDERGYRPVTRASLAAGAHARRLQSGSLGAYVAYLIGLVIALLAAARFGVLG